MFGHNLQLIFPIRLKQRGGGVNDLVSYTAALSPHLLTFESDMASQASQPPTRHGSPLTNRALKTDQPERPRGS